ncbi:cell adhesion molecule CEACAM5-like [Brevipalpus obovatus]|uniref:cell adhesion molecule CEACAM5-like n=1 Tax=Brevipalpus obovatus TaxID=246614 RepID=UPI003D9EFE55
MIHSNAALMKIKKFSTAIVISQLALSILTTASIQIYGLENRQVEIPCNTSVMNTDNMILVLWFRNANATGASIYSVDARENVRKDHFTSTDANLTGRIRFENSHPFSSLRISHLKKSDAGIYSCRVDFHTSPTRLTISHLHVIVPPKSLTVTDRNQSKSLIGKVGPYREGSILRLSCEAEEAQSTQSISWIISEPPNYTHSSLINASIVVRNTSKIMRSDLDLLLTRDILDTKITCQILDEKFGPIKNVTIKIDLYLKPLSVKVRPHKSVVAGIKEIFSCESKGSKPLPFFRWKINGKPINKIQSLKIVNSTREFTSQLLYEPSRDEDGANLTCEVSNQNFPASNSLIDSVKLNVWDKPIAQLSFLTTSTSNNTFREDSTVRLLCNTSDSNPGVEEIIWYVGSTVLDKKTDSNSGYSFLGEELQIKNLSNKHVGRYKCRARNAMGFSLSNEIGLNVEYSPMCVSGQKIIYAMVPNQILQISCEMEAYPIGMTFSWTNSNGGPFPPDWLYNISQKGSISYIEILRASNLPTEVACSAQNSVGSSREPCIKTILQAGPPDSPFNCSLSDDMTRISCLPSLDPIGDQKFVAMIFNNNEVEKLVTSLEQNGPIFNVNFLKPNTSYWVEIFSKNTYGYSRKEVIRFTTKRLESSQGSFSFFSGPNSFYIYTYVVPSLLIIIAIFVIFLIHSRKRSSIKITEQSFKSSKYNGKRDTNVSISAKENNIPQTETVVGFEKQLLPEEEALIKNCESNEVVEKLREMASVACYDPANREGILGFQSERKMLAPNMPEMPGIHFTSV